MMVIGLTGYARVGKDTVANHLVDVGGFTRVAFADPLREIVAAMDPLLRVYWPDGTWSSQNLSKLAYDDAWLKTNTDYREYLKALGNGAREHIAEDVWIQAAARSIFRAADAGASRVVLSDCRFKNEAEFLTDVMGGYIWRIIRDGYGPESDFELASDEIVADFTFGAPDVPSLQLGTEVVLAGTLQRRETDR